MSDLILFAVFPYVAVALAISGGIYRYARDRFTYSSLSSQFLERQRLFWGSVPWHYGIVILLIGHLVGWAIPSAVEAFNAVPLRLYILEITALGLGLLSLFGICALILRRMTVRRIRVVTSPMDAVLLGLLLLQVLTGVYTAIFSRWGTAWYLSNAVPYLQSLMKLDPQVQFAATLPLVTRIHVVSAWLLVAIFPFSRLVHIFTLPVTYLWRPYQTVVWNRRQS